MISPHQIIENINADGGSYHKLFFPDGTILNGKFDMSKYLKFYNIPDDLSGMTVLDVGSSTGFFSFEFSKRGASRVVGIHNEPNSEVPNAMNNLMGTNVEFMTKDLFTLDESFGKFDLVFCSNVLQHVSDQVGALRKLRMVTKEHAIICTSIINNRKLNDFAVSWFGGSEHKTKTGDPYWIYHLPTFNCLKKMTIFAKFQKVEHPKTFTIKSEDGKNEVYEGVLHAFV